MGTSSCDLEKNVSALRCSDPYRGEGSKRAGRLPLISGRPHIWTEPCLPFGSPKRSHGWPGGTRSSGASVLGGEKRVLKQLTGIGRGDAPVGEGRAPMDISLHGETTDQPAHASGPQSTSLQWRRRQGRQPGLPHRLQAARKGTRQAMRKGNAGARAPAKNRRPCIGTSALPRSALQRL